MDARMKGHPYVKSAIDMACWDILGKIILVILLVVLTSISLMALVVVLVLVSTMVVVR